MRLLALPLLALAATASGQTPYLVQDIAPQGPPAAVREPQALTATGQGLFMIAATTGERVLLRVSEGIVSQVRTLPAPFPGEIPSMVAIGDRLVFTVAGELWTSDGTNAGTQLLHDFGTAAATGRLAVVGGTVYVAVGSGSSNVELWKSDGTAAGTVRVAVQPTTWGYQFVSAATRVYFGRVTDKIHMLVGTSDGTTAGTFDVGIDIPPYPLDAAALGDTLLVGGPQFGLDGPLRRSDGTAGGSTVIATFPFPSQTYGYPHALTTVGPAVLFGAGTPEGLWRSDGTTGGTVLVRSGLAVRDVYAAGATAFVLTDDPGGAHLWTSDGTTGGTVQLLPLPACTPASPGENVIATLGAGIVFARRGCPDLWRSDGTAAGTAVIASFPPHPPGYAVREATPSGGLVYFAAFDGTEHRLWRTDGTTAGTAPVTWVVGEPSGPQMWGASAGRVFFGATRADLGFEPWSTDGTAVSTAPIEMTPGPEGTQIQPAVALPGRFTFGSLGRLFATDGASAPLNLGEFQPRVPLLAAVNGGVGVYANTSQSPVRTDGTIEGTFFVAAPAGIPGQPRVVSVPEAFTSYADGFAAASEPTFSSLQEGVWLTSGAPEPATQLTQVPCFGVVAAEERLFMACSAPFSQHGLWVSDGTRSGSRLLVPIITIVPGWAVAEGRLFFRSGAAPNRELWTSDGTVAGTYPLSSIVPLPAGFEPHALTAANGLLYFAATTPANGRELWRTDGTAAGTFLLRDILPGPTSSLGTDLESAGRIVAAGAGVVFAASSAGAGEELWMSDGTAAGTIPLPQIAPGAAGASPRSFLHAYGRVFLSADDGTRGAEPWAIALPSSVRVGDATVPEGDSGTTAARFAVTLEPAAPVPVVVAYQTVGGSAQAGTDFVAASGAVTFPPGASAREVEVAVVGDTADEAHEAFTVRVTSATAVVADGRGAAVILDDDAPVVTVQGTSALESVEEAVFPVTLTTGGQPTAAPVIVRAGVESGTASVLDFPSPSVIDPGPSVTFPAGTASGTTLPLRIPVLDDETEEPNETFHVRLDSGHDARVPQPQAVVGVILDDDGVAAAPPVEVGHGSVVVAGLTPPPGRSSDVDFYVLQQNAWASYEVVADAVSGDAVPLVVERVAANGTVTETSQPVGTGSSVSLRFFGQGALGRHVRVRSLACGSTCGADDTYRLRVYETTLAAPRVNNVGTQRTIAIVQNLTDRPVEATLALWNPGGSRAARQDVTIPPRGTAVVDTKVLSPQFAGSLTFLHDAPYGGLVGKVVGIDSSTGFSVEAPLTAKPR